MQWLINQVILIQVSLFKNLLATKMNVEYLTMLKVRSISMKEG